MLFGGKTLGLDVGRSTIKLVARGWRGKVLEVAETPTMANRQSYDDEPSAEQITAGVRHLLAKHLEKRTQVYASVQGDGAVGGYIELPSLAAKQRELAVESAAVKQLPYSGSEAILNYLEVPGLDKTAGPAWFFLAVRKIAGDPVLSSLQSLEVEPERLEIHALALLRSFAAAHAREAHHVYAVVHAGARLTTVLVLKGPHPYALRSFKIGGDDFTYALQMGLQTDWAEAEARKRATPASAREVSVEPALLRWLEQVERSLKRFTREKIGGVVLSGGCAAWTGLDERVSQTLGLPVVVARPAVAGVNPDEYARYAVALGLGL